MSADLSPDAPKHWQICIYDMPPEHGVKLDEEHEGWKPNLYLALHRDENGVSRSYQTTYFGSRVCIDSTVPLLASRQKAFEAKFPGGHVRKGENIFFLAAKLHDPDIDRINFQCSPTGIVAFLKDRRAKELFRLEQISLNFAFGGTPGLVEMSGYAWRAMLKFLRHEYPLLRNMCIVVGKEFWQRADWWNGARGIYNRDRTLPQIAKVAPLRWRIGEHPLLPSWAFVGTNLLLCINGEDEAWAAREFGDELRAVLEEERRDRPLLLRTPHGVEVTYGHGQIEDYEDYE